MTAPGSERPVAGANEPTRGYRVGWQIDVQAASPTDAARQALAVQRRPGSTATVFDVQWTDTLGDQAGTEVTSRVQIDLDPADPPTTPHRPAPTRLQVLAAFTVAVTDPGWTEQDLRERLPDQLTSLLAEAAAAERWHAAHPGEPPRRYRVDPAGPDGVDRPRRPPIRRPQWTGALTVNLNLPTVTLDPGRARGWLTEPAEQDPAETNAEYCGVTDIDPPFGWESDHFLARADDLIAVASRARLFGPGAGLQLYLSADHDGVTDGGLLVVSVHPPAGRPALRVASHHLDYADLIWDTAQTGLDAAVGVLRAAAATAAAVLAHARRALTGPAAAAEGRGRPAMTSTPGTCARCGTETAARWHGAPWCPGCRIQLVRHEPTGEWVSHAELERRRRQARDAAAVEATRRVALDALPAAHARIPRHWRATVDPPPPGATWALTIAPAAGPVDVSAQLTPPHSGRGWQVRIHHRTGRVGYPLYTPGGAQAAQFGGLADAVDAAVAALLLETDKGGR